MHGGHHIITSQYPIHLLTCTYGGINSPMAAFFIFESLFLAYIEFYQATSQAILTNQKREIHEARSTVKAANRKFISFMSFENITFIYRTFQVWAWPLLDKRSTSEEYVLGLTDSIYKLVTWCVGHVVLVNNPILFWSHLIFESARA